MENAIYKTSDIHRVIERQASRNRDKLPEWDYDSPTAKKALGKTHVLMNVWEKVLTMESGTRFSGDEAKAPVYVENAHNSMGEDFHDWLCPVCGEKVGELYVPMDHVQSEEQYCPECGQRIDWVSVRKAHKHGGFSDTVDAEKVLTAVNSVLVEGEETAVSMVSYLRGKLGALPRVDVSAETGKPPVLRKHQKTDFETGTYVTAEEYCCPVCNWFVGRRRSTAYGAKKRPCRFCDTCGQKIDWSNVELGDEYESVADS